VIAVEWSQVPGWVSAGGVLGAAGAIYAARRDVARTAASSIVVIAHEYSYGDSEGASYTIAEVANYGDRPAVEVTVMLRDCGRRRLLSRLHNSNRCGLGETWSSASGRTSALAPHQGDL
jgi:hypothetical protein